MSNVSESLRWLVDRLGAGRGGDAAGAGDSGLNWVTLIELSDHYSLTPALWGALQASGQGTAMPSECSDYVASVHRLNLTRNSALRAQLDEVVSALNARGIEPVLLKGATHLVTDVYADKAGRVMGDLDLFVDRSEQVQALAALDDLGYNLKPEDRDRFDAHHHAAPRYHEDRLAPVEVHTGLIENEFAHLLPPEVARPNTEAVASNGWSARLLNPAYRIIHNVLHSAIVNGFYDQSELDLQSLYEIHRMVQRYTGEIDWREVVTTFESYRIKPVLEAYVHAANRLYGTDVPFVRGGVGAHSYYLRALARVRWRKYDRIEEALYSLSSRRIRDRYRLSAGARPFTLNLKRAQYLMERVRGHGL